MLRAIVAPVAGSSSIGMRARIGRPLASISRTVRPCAWLRCMPVTMTSSVSSEWACTACKVRCIRPKSARVPVT